MGQSSQFFTRKVYSTHFTKDFLSLFIDLSAERVVSYCLSISDADTEITQKGKTSLANRMVLYVEGHIEAEKYDQQLMDTVAKSVPLQITPALHMSVGDEVLNTMFIPEDDLFVFFKPPCAIGFYAQTSDRYPLAMQHKRLAQYYAAFRENLYERLKTSESRKLPTLELDFLYDYSRAWDFDSDGVLNSKIAKEILTRDASSQTTREWLRGSK